MAAFNNGFPVTYPQFNPYQMPQMAQPQMPQQMSQPTIHADIIQVASEQDVQNANVAAGTSQIFMAKDDSTFWVKTAYPNGQSKVDAWDRRPPAPPAKQPDYVTREELDARLAEILANHKKETDA